MQAKRSKLSFTVLNVIRIPVALFIAHAFDMEWKAHYLPIHLGKRKSREFTSVDLIVNHAGGKLTSPSSVLKNIEQASIEMEICHTLTTNLTVTRRKRMWIMKTGYFTTSGKRRRSYRAVDAAELLNLVISDKILREERRPRHFILNLLADVTRIRKFNICWASLLCLEIGRGHIGEPLFKW
jgi:hypothetical protein